MSKVFIHTGYKGEGKTFWLLSKLHEVSKRNTNCFIITQYPIELRNLMEQYYSYFGTSLPATPVMTNEIQFPPDSVLFIDELIYYLHDREKLEIINNARAAQATLYITLTQDKEPILESNITDPEQISLFDTP